MLSMKSFFQNFNMGWFGIGGKGNNPIDQVQIPEDQMPPEVEKPGSISKAIQSENSEYILFNLIRKINLKSVYEIIAKTQWCMCSI